MKFDRKQFFDKYRESFGRLSKKQVDGLEFLLSAIENDPAWKLIEEIAYVLSTTYHETAHTFQPITEYRARAGTKARANQDRYWEPYRGRGFVQITWKRNYEKFGIADEPEKAREPETAYRILSEGMRKGVFTGKKLGDFINETELDYYEARTVVNGHDKAQLLATIAEKFERILRTSLVTNEVTEHSPQPKIEEPKAEVTKPEVSQIHVEHADEVTGTPPPIPGTTKDDPPMQASQGGKKSLIATIVGVVAGAGTAVQGWMQNSNALKVVGLVCITVVLLALIFRQLIMDYVRLNYMSDPSRLNVK